MNKGIFYHIIATIIYILCILYITNGIDTDWFIRLIIVLGVGFTNLFIFFNNDIDNNYNKKI